MWVAPRLQLPLLLMHLAQNLPKRWAFYTTQVNDLTFDEADERNQFPIPWTIFQYMTSNSTALLPTLKNLAWRCTTARCATALTYFINDRTLRHLDLGLSDYFAVDIPEARNLLLNLSRRNLRLTTCKLRMLEDSPFEHPVGEDLMQAVVKFLRSIPDVREIVLSPSLLSQDVLEQLAHLSNICSFTINGRDPTRPWATPQPLEVDVEHPRLSFESLDSVETVHVGIATCNAVLQRSKLHFLSTIRVWTAYLPPVQAIVDFLAAVGQLPQLESLSLQVSAAIPLENERRDFAVPPHALEPLYTCPRLTQLELVLACPTLLSRDAARRMALSWPKMRVLRLSGAGCEGIGFRSRLNLSTLLEFAEACPDLQVLHLDVNADMAELDRNRLHHVAPEAQARRARLEKLEVGWSWWAPSGPTSEDVADALLEIFPHGYMELKWDVQLPKHIIRRWREVRETVNMYH